MLHLRRAEAGDALAATLLREAVAAEDRWIGSADPSQRDAQVQRFVDNLARSDAAFWVAEDDGEIVGTIGISTDRGVSQLGMLIRADRRGQGLGRTLLLTAIEWARETGSHKIVLEVWPHNERARRLYLGAGFEDEGRRRRHHRRPDGSLWDSIEMALILDETSPGCPYDRPGDA